MPQSSRALDSTLCFLLLGQMDPKLRPSFSDIVKYLEEVLARGVEELQHEGVSLSVDNDKKTMANGNNKGVMPPRSVC